jgi:hypothetical protein
MRREISAGLGNSAWILVKILAYVFPDVVPGIAKLRLHNPNTITVANRTLSDQLIIT